MEIVKIDSLKNKFLQKLVPAKIWTFKVHVPLLRSISPLCPVTAYLHAANLLADSSCVPAFAYKNPDGSSHPLLAQEFVRLFRSLMIRAGVSSASQY